MKVKANISFTGATFSMVRGQEREITDEVILSDLIKAGHVSPLEEKQPEIAANNDETKAVTDDDETKAVADDDETKAVADDVKNATVAPEQPKKKGKAKKNENSGVDEQ